MTTYLMTGVTQTETLARLAALYPDVTVTVDDGDVRLRTRSIARARAMADAARALGYDAAIWPAGCFATESDVRCTD